MAHEFNQNDICAVERRNQGGWVMAKMNAFTVDDATVAKLEAAGFAPVLRWVRPFKSEKVYKTQEALAYMAKKPKTKRASELPGDPEKP